MKALTLTPDGPRLELRREKPAAAGEALLAVRQAGVCATDLELAKGYMNFAGVLGHEFVATVESAPDGKLVGKRVVGEINCVCGTCDLCQRGLRSHCRNRSVLGILNRDGCFADYVRLPTENLHVLPESVDDDAAVFVEPLAAAVQITKQIRLDEKTWVTVLGDGRLGLLVAQVIRNTGAPVRLLGRHERKLALAERWQVRARNVADVKPRSDQDVVVDCTGSAAGLELALELCRPRGTVVLKSTVADPKPMNLAKAVVDEITIVGSRCGPFRDAIATLADGSVDVASLIHKRMKLDNAVEALELAGKPGVLKVILTM
ncbi:MAG: alcohol dehydrogenase catalytic domain-containing protein [Planctomycetota bacterium]